MNEVQPLKNIIENLQSFLEVSPMQKESFIHIHSMTMHMSNRILLETFPKH